MNKKLLNLLLVIVMLVVLVPTVLAAPPAQEGQDYVVVADDWLSKLADKYLGNALAYPAIVHYTNQKNAKDASYAKITDPDLIEVGWKIYIPSAAEAKAYTEEAVGPEYGGTLIMGSPSEPPHLNPLNNLRITHWVSGQLFPALVEHDFKMNPKPSLAEEWEISEDGMIYTFYLRKEAKWTDGTPITADDVKFSFEEMIIPHHPSGKAYFSAIESIETPDENTVVFKLSEPFAPLMSFLGHMTAAIFPKHVYEGTDPLENPNNFEPTVTGGPFVFDEWVKGDHITLVRNDDYFREGLPYLDRIIVRFIPDASARVLALETGEIDYIPSAALPESEIDHLKAVEGIALSNKGAEALLEVVTFGFNLRREPFNDPMVRRAIHYAVDKQFIAEAVTYGHSPVAPGPIHPSSWAYDPDIVSYDFDPEKAQQMLDEAGYPVGADGTRFSMNITFRPDVFVWAKGVEVIADNLRDIGIDVELRPLESAAYYPTVYENWDFDMGTTSWLSGPDPHNIATIYHSDNIRPLIFTNFMAYSNTEVDALFDEARRETDMQKRKDLYSQIQSLIIEDSPAVWLVANVPWQAFKDTFHGIPPGPWQGTRDPFSEVWMEQ